MDSDCRCDTDILAVTRSKIISRTARARGKSNLLPDPSTLRKIRTSSGPLARRVRRKGCRNFGTGYPGIIRSSVTSGWIILARYFLEQRVPTFNPKTLDPVTTRNSAESRSRIVREGCRASIPRRCIYTLSSGGSAEAIVQI